MIGHLAPSHWLGLASALLGVIGTVLLFEGGWALESPSVWMDADFEEKMKRRSRRSVALRRWGLGLIFASFTVSAIANLID